MHGVAAHTRVFEPVLIVNDSGSCQARIYVLLIAIAFQYCVMHSCWALRYKKRVHLLRKVGTWHGKNDPSLHSCLIVPEIRHFGT